MNEFFKGFDGGTGRWVIAEDESVYFVDEATGRWCVSEHTAKFIRGMEQRGILQKTVALPFFPVLVPAG
ncbi:hypothetical protein [Amycolatopsis lexingtonensis]|uniref:hypothetical protein n=1 Tax=Amycolatopsis lexingtonensis TaxID=218822 RepID=UPI003F730954